jgi:ribonuclease HI
VITDERGRVLAEIAEGLGVATNNQAEYTAVLQGLRRARELGATRVTLRSDSRLLIEQLEGRYRVKNPALQRLHRLVREVAASFERVNYEHVTRERNRDADRLANAGVDAMLAAGELSRPSGPRPWEEAAGPG